MRLSLSACHRDHADTHSEPLLLLLYLSSSHLPPSRACIRLLLKVKEDLLDYDVVITTYNVVQQEHGNHLAAAAAASSSSASGSGGRKKHAARSDSDTDDSDGAFGASLASSSKKKAAKKPGRIFSAASAGMGKRALFAVRWHRVILDEAQNIKNRASKTAKACIALESKYRWCLTGTPIQVRPPLLPSAASPRAPVLSLLQLTPVFALAQQNNIEELYPLFAFLRIRPLNDWDYFKSTIAKPVKEGRTKLAMKKLQVRIWLDEVSLPQEKSHFSPLPPVSLSSAASCSAG